ncbi:hypothetical protein [Celerinatantimonas diazotrophica]|uniref:Uncharacterized protein n=1 Tax=Celerinatantimonas diazotrophica TaxID=412034 RepID=A0A4R1JNR2_9GAMM|nr:hypothetical protein [Celerinatantimonas diazotrophica]TCK52159.1 hypothetical protein EV690_2267 [Celerinatantimonas diazotrophica]CAG9296136.1 hypothetical protein CEDIAZO_01279 [Celerinatantimonas diazotrophica]
MDDEHLAQLEIRSEQLLSQLVAILKLPDSDIGQVHFLLSEHQNILEQLTLNAGPNSPILQRRLASMQQLTEQISDSKDEIKQQLSVLSQAKRLAKTYNPQR